MINRDNWKLIKAYLDYRIEVDQVSIKTVKLEESWLRYFLDWTDEKQIEKIQKIRPTFPEYVLTNRLDGEESQLSPAYIKKIISSAKRFLEWLVKHRSGFTSVITPAWLDTLKPPRLETEIKEHEAVTYEEILAMASAPVHSLRDRRIRAAAVFWYLSGIRVGAFVTLPINAVILNELRVNQWPSLGVKTKFNKKMVAHLLNIPELLKVVREWDQEVRSKLPVTSFWFAPLSPETGTFDATITEAGEHRNQRARKDLQEWLNRVGLPYHSPHKFRHGFAVFGLTHSDDIGDLKAVSQNLGHASLSTTDGVYGVLSTADVGKRISGLGQRVASGEVSQAELIAQMAQLSEMLKKTMGIAGTK